MKLKRRIFLRNSALLGVLFPFHSSVSATAQIFIDDEESKSIFSVIKKLSASFDFIRIMKYMTMTSKCVTEADMTFDFWLLLGYGVCPAIEFAFELGCHLGTL